MVNTHPGLSLDRERYCLTTPSVPAVPLTPSQEHFVSGYMDHYSNRSWTLLVAKKTSLGSHGAYRARCWGDRSFDAPLEVISLIGRDNSLPPDRLVVGWDALVGWESWAAGIGGSWAVRRSRAGCRTGGRTELQDDRYSSNI